MCSSPVVIGQRFVRRTSLHPDEHRTNFRQVDCEVIATLTSDEASAVTAQMSKIYLCLINAPSCYWERDGVLRFTGEEREGKWHTAWEQLVSLVGVASATARKALAWMSEQAIIGYYAGRNGAGIRIFINRASSSIGHKSQKTKKNLGLVPASSVVLRTSQIEACFNDSFAVLESLDTELNPHVPKNGTDPEQVSETLSDPPARVTKHLQVPTPRKGREGESGVPHSSIASVNEIIDRLRSVLEPCVKSAAIQAATQATTREVARTREWFETKALPKAVRVAQHETYDLLKKQLTLDERKKRARADLQVGRAAIEYVAPEVRARSPEEIIDTAQMCIALLEVQGRSVDATLSELSSEGGGWLLPGDALKVREATQRLLLERSGRR